MGWQEKPYLRCTYCGKWENRLLGTQHLHHTLTIYPQHLAETKSGKRLWMNNPIVNSLYDVDYVDGQLCEACLLREAPPHSNKYRRILPKVLSSETAVNILEFVFTAVSEFEARRRDNMPE